MKYRLTRHALEEMQRRGISLEVIESIMESPAQVVPEKEGKKAYQTRVMLETGKEFLIRVIVDDTREPSVVITAYRTSNIQKYWRTP